MRIQVNANANHPYPWGKDRDIFFPGYNDKYHHLHVLLCWGEDYEAGVPMVVNLMNGKIVSKKGHKTERLSNSFKIGGDDEFFVQYDAAGALYFSDSLAGGAVLDIAGSPMGFRKGEFLENPGSGDIIGKHQLSPLPMGRIDTHPPLFDFQTEWYTSPPWLTTHIPHH